jgi:molybdopterin adenylyltransferase
LKIQVITISDRAYSGEYEDLSGPAVVEILTESIEGCEVDLVVVPDDEDQIELALERGLGGDAVVTTGGTGIGPRDITPDITARFCRREVPGVSEMLRAKSLNETQNAALSRGYAGIRDRTLFVNLPGSVEGASFCARLIAPLLTHAAGMLKGEGH